MVYKSSMDIETSFIREFEVNANTVLRVHQTCVGDVGCVVWDAALVLSKYLTRLVNEKNENSHEKRPNLRLPGSKVVEIGSGTGIVGLTAAALGADVILTDLPEIVPLLEKNVHHNRHAVAGNVSVAELRWGAEGAQRLAVIPDIVLVSDCLYYAESLEPLLTTLKCLCDDKTTIVFSYEERNSDAKKSLERAFFHMIEGTFSVYRVPTAELHHDFRSDDIHVLLLRRKVHVDLPLVANVIGSIRNVTQSAAITS